MSVPFRNLSLSSIGTHPSLAWVKNSISIFDNLDSNPDVSDDQRAELVMVPTRFSRIMSVLVCRKGSAVVRMGIQDYILEDRDCLFVRTGTVAKLRSMDDYCVFFSILLNEDYYFPVFDNAALALLQRNWIQNPVCKLGEEDLKEAEALYRRIKERLQNTGEELFRPEIIKGYVQSLLYILYSSYFTRQEEAPKEKVSRRRDLYNRFVELVEKEFSRQRNIIWYAGELGITPRYLAQVVYQESGNRASEYIDNFVISEAKQLLRSHQYSVQQVCDMMGFTSQSFFGRYFKRLTGYTPTQFQKLD